MSKIEPFRIRIAESEFAQEKRLPLHDMPVLYLLVVLLASLEWLLRRRRHLA